MSFGLGVTVVLGLYLALILGLGLYARRARESDSLSDFYLASRSLGSVVLLLTLYATQYSGNSLLGYPGETYRMGFPWVMSIGFMMAIVVVYLIIAPRLSLLSQRHGYVTPGDWLDHRFGSPALSLLANTLLVAAIANYLLAQMMAMGHVVAGLSDGNVPYWMGVVLLGLVIIIYETLGGLRAVAWTDCFQGLLLLVGLTGLLIAAAPGPSALAEVTAWILENQPEKAVVPSWTMRTTWVSTTLLIGFSGAVYPQAIQRIYAARSVRVLRRSLSAMIFMPLFTTVPVFLIGIFGIRHFSSLGGVAADQVMPMLLREWADQSLWMYVMALLVVLGIVAAIMSTADSVLLSMSSMLAKDFAGKHVWRRASEADLTRLGKILSWAIMAIMMIVALSPRITLWGLIELKMEILVQVSPAFLLGLTWRRVRAPAVIVGMASGSTLAAGLALTGYGRVAGLHAGLIGWALNLGLITALTLLPGFLGEKAEAGALNQVSDLEKGSG